MVSNRKKHTPKTRAKQEADPVIPKPIKIGAATPYDFQGSNLTAYGGLLPVATMLEKLQFRELIEQHVTINRRKSSGTLVDFAGQTALDQLLYGG